MKKIGISGSILVNQNRVFLGKKRSYVNDDYVKTVMLAGGIPLIIPVNTESDVIKAQIENVDGIILSGGYDVNPLLFGEEPHKLLGATLGERDLFESLLIKYALEMGKPILGICRGCQILNVICGGTLYQDCSLAENSYIKHSQENTPSQPSHTVMISEDSELYSIFGEKVLVNSFHHMSIKRVADEFKVIARAGDDIIEAIERISGSFAMGIQWHAEMMAGSNENMLKIFKLFISKCENT